MREKKQTRLITTEFQARTIPDDEGSDNPIIEGYFIVYNQETELWPGAFEEVASTACDKTLGNDIRALNDHISHLVLGRNKVGTLTFRNDDHGLWGSVQINQDDQDAMNLYARVKRGDVDQASFGFNILSEETEWRDDGTVKWTITEIDLHEVSVVTFPAYEQTGISARKVQVEEHRQRLLDARKSKLKERLQNA